MKKTVLIIDIKSSKNIGGEKRIKVQKKFASIVDDIINVIYKDALIAKIDFSAGDSVQGVFKNTADAIGCYLLIKVLMFPNEVRCGVGFGNILEAGFNDTNRLDGEAYHNAKLALDICKKEDYNFLINSKTEYDIFINQYILTAQYFESKQSTKQKPINNLIFILNPIGFNIFSKEYYPLITGFTCGHVENVNIQNISCLNLEVFRGIMSRENPAFYAKDNGFVMDKKIVDSSLQRGLSSLFNVTPENIRQMINKANINEIKKNYVCAISLSEKIC